MRVAVASGTEAAQDKRLAARLHVNSALRRAAESTAKLAGIQLDPTTGRLVALLGVLDFMSSRSSHLLGGALEAFRELDPDRAGSLAQGRDAVNEVYLRLHDDVLEVAARNPSSIEAANSMLWFAHHLDAVAEHAMDICEQTFLLCGTEYEGDDAAQLARELHWYTRLDAAYRRH
jgi:phosphate uptake regulator